MLSGARRGKRFIQNQVQIQPVAQSLIALKVYQNVYFGTNVESPTVPIIHNLSRHAQGYHYSTCAVCGRWDVWGN